MLALSLVAFVVVFGLIVLVHEFGHFLVARRVGIKVLEFGIGYPPRLKTLAVRDGVEFTLNVIPLGGFVRMLGEEDPSAAGSFASKPARARIATLLAGPAMNLLLATVLFAALLMFAGLAFPTGKVLVRSVVANSPAEQAGVLAGDAVVGIGGQEVKSTVELAERTHAVLGQEVELAVLRGEQRLSVRLTPRSSPPDGEGAMGVVISDDYRIERQPVWRALPLALQWVWSTLMAVVLALVGLLRGGVSPSDMAGPIGLAQASGEVARLGMLQLMEFTANISVNIAFVQLLPLPVLEGGRVATVLLEKLRGGRRMAPQREAFAQIASLLLILMLVLVLSYFDILRVITGQRILR